MARPPKNTADSLLYNPQKIAMRVSESKGKKALKKYLRNSSSCYIARKTVREYIFNRDGEICAICGTTKNLQIDHIISVYLATVKTIYEINHVNNLRVLCGSCNARRAPNG